MELKLIDASQFSFSQRMKTLTTSRLLVRQKIPMAIAMMMVAPRVT